MARSSSPQNLADHYPQNGPTNIKPLDSAFHKIKNQHLKAHVDAFTSTAKSQVSNLYSRASLYMDAKSPPAQHGLVRLVAFVLAIATSAAVLAFTYAQVCVQVLQMLVHKNPAVHKRVNRVLQVLSDLATDHRGILVTFIVSPCSRIWDSYDQIQDWISDSTMPKVGNVAHRREIHQSRVQAVQIQIQNVVGLGATRLCTDRPGFLTMSMRKGIYKSKWTGINVHSLRDVIEINEARQVVLVEPGCTMGRLSRLLLSQGWTLQVIPELDELTVGGLINGFGIETSSHKYGLFQHTCVSFEVVLPSGELVKCDSNNHPDLFAAIPWSHGTVGFLVGAEIKLVRASPYVKLEYHPCYTAAQATSTFEKASRDARHDFVESLQFSRNTSVVMVGQFSKTVPKGETVNSLTKWYKPWFYTHVESVLAGRNTVTEYVPIRDYYHRHTKSLFWAMKDIVPYGNQVWYRYLLNWIGTPKVGLLKLCTTPKMNELWTTKQVAQDLLVPMITLDYVLDMVQNELDVYPIWLCPMRMLSPSEDLLALRKDPSTVLKAISNERKQQDVLALVTPKGSFVPPHPADQLYVDVGVYGIPKAPTFHHVRTLERIEDHVRSVQGYSACYADIVSSREQFRMMFDHRNLDQVRQVYRSNGLLPDVFEKVHKSARE